MGIVDILCSLVDKSLVQVDKGSGNFSVLEVIRLAARGCLVIAIAGATTNNLAQAA